MGPKKESKGPAGEAAEGEDPAVFLSNYTKFCKEVVCYFTVYSLMYPQYLIIIHCHKYYLNAD